MTNFTFYGDLLGVSNYYKISSQVAYERLNDFYNTTFFSLSDYCRANVNVKVYMFSDSLLIHGHSATEMLNELHRVYIKLLYKGLFLRGAMVAGEVSFDPRLTMDNYSKMLPQNDTLAKAVALEKSQKGARLIIESGLGETIMEECKSWITLDGYLENPNKYKNIGTTDVRRRIVPTPDFESFELLYFWNCSQSMPPLDVDYKEFDRKLKSLAKMTTKEIAAHYQATIELFERCKERQKLTDRYLGI